MSHFLWLVLKRSVQSLWVIFFKKGSILWVMFTKVQIWIFLEKKKCHVVKGVGPFLSEFVEKKKKKHKSLIQIEKKFHLPSHKKVFNSWSQKNLQKGSILWVIFLGKKSTFFVKKVQFFESNFWKSGSILWVKFNQRAQFFALCWKKRFNSLQSR